MPTIRSFLLAGQSFQSLKLFCGSLFHCRYNSIDTALEISFQVMLPNVDHGPTHITEFSAVFGISFTVFGNLLFPKIRYFVFPGWETVAVPKIAVNKYCHFSLDKDDIWCAWEVFDMPAEPKAAAMKCGTDRYL